MGVQASKPISPTDLTEYRAQLSRSVTVVKFRGTVRRAQAGARYSKRRHLYLGANEVFFDAGKQIQAIKSQTSKDGIRDLSLNQHKLFKYVSGLGRSLKATLFWSFYSTRRTSVTLYLNLDVQVACTVRLSFDRDLKSERIEDIPLLPSNAKTQLYAVQRIIPRVKPGFHTIRVQVIQNNKPGQTIGTLHYCKLSSKRPLSAVRERWRPLATHIGFRSTTARKAKLTNIGQFVMSMQKIPSLGAFAPISTQFGYYGPILNAQGKATGMNFSIWSFSHARKNNPPPQRQWSHLVALGSPSMQFGEFSHEGTGVKPRGDESLFKNLQPPYTVALRLESEPTGFGGFFTTYTSYYWTGDKWQFFAAGKEFSAHRVSNLNPRAFIEVAGVAERQRTNHVPRVVTYQGFIAARKVPTRVDTLRATQLSHLADLDEGLEEESQDVESNLGHDGDHVNGLDEIELRHRKMEDVPEGWHMLDQIQEHGGSGFTNKRWSAKDGYLQASCGGLDQKPHLAVSTWHTMQAVGAWPDFMHHIDEIHNPLPYPTIHKVTDVSGVGRGGVEMVELEIDIPAHNDSQVCKIYSGDTDGLTIARLWKRMNKFQVHNGTQTLLVPAAKFYRALLERSDGRYWSLHPSRT